MYNVKVFPSFSPGTNSSDKDLEFLAHLRNAQKETGARFVNFSAYRFKAEKPDTIHFVTYPLDWVTHYIRSNYMDIDPLIHFDYRRISFLEWEEFRRTRSAEAFFEDFQSRGLGDHGVILTCHRQSGIYGVSNFCFSRPAQGWEAFRRERMEILRFLTNDLTETYETIYDGMARRQFNITNREKECLFWVAMGKTDEEIGDLLSIGKWTVVSHLKSAKYKLGTANRTAAVARALATGVIKLEIDGG